MGLICASCPNRRADQQATNHDISVGEMLDESDEEAIGLLGRSPELQFVRLAEAYNELKERHQQAVNDALERAAVAIEVWQDVAFSVAYLEGMQKAAAIVRGMKENAEAHGRRSRTVQPLVGHSESEKGE